MAEEEEACGRDRAAAAAEEVFTCGRATAAAEEVGSSDVDDGGGDRQSRERAAGN
jgi:hypothetical protein